MIRRYMNRVHVSTPDDEIAADIGGRAIAAGWGPLGAISAIALALECHHENQATYRRVVGPSH